MIECILVMCAVRRLLISPDSEVLEETKKDSPVCDTVVPDGCDREAIMCAVFTGHHSFLGV